MTSKHAAAQVDAATPRLRHYNKADGTANYRAAASFHGGSGAAATRRALSLHSAGRANNASHEH